ncbi:MAG: response regulator transcription factor [Acidimicrobiales bacterium]
MEDNYGQSRPIAQLLRHRGYDVVPVYDGPSAIERAREYHPDLVLIDLLLVERGDKLDGYDVISQLRGHPDTKEVGIIALSGHYIRGQDEIRALRLGADDFVRKETEFGVLEARIEAVLRRVHGS